MASGEFDSVCNCLEGDAFGDVWDEIDCRDDKSDELFGIGVFFEFGTFSDIQKRNINKPKWDRTFSDSVQNPN